MRLMGVRAALVGAVTLLGGCVQVYGPGPFSVAVARVDPEEAAERAIVGAALGTALGTGLGAIFAINPGVGSVIGAETGATLGAAAGVITTQPLPSYGPVVLPSTPTPEFYDTWPPGYRGPPSASQVPPPRPG